MKLPPSIHALLPNNSDTVLAHAIAHEACRLQQLADEDWITNYPDATEMGLLVVPEAE